MKIKLMIRPGRMGVSCYINVELVMLVVLINRAPLVILIYPGTIFRRMMHLNHQVQQIALIINVIESRNQFGEIYRVNSPLKWINS